MLHSCPVSTFTRISLIINLNEEKDRLQVVKLANGLSPHLKEKQSYTNSQVNLHNFSKSK